MNAECPVFCAMLYCFGNYCTEICNHNCIIRARLARKKENIAVARTLRVKCYTESEVWTHYMSADVYVL